MQKNICKKTGQLKEITFLLKFVKGNKYHSMC